MIRFTANGKECKKDSPLSVSDLINSLSLSPKTVIVEYNHEYLDKRCCETTMIQDGDTLEIIRAFAGG